MGPGHSKTTTDAIVSASNYACGTEVPCVVPGATAQISASWKCATGPDNAKLIDAGSVRNGRPHRSHCGLLAPIKANQLWIGDTEPSKGSFGCRMTVEGASALFSGGWLEEPIPATHLQASKIGPWRRRHASLLPEGFATARPSVKSRSAARADCAKRHRERSPSEAGSSLS